IADFGIAKIYSSPLAPREEQSTPSHDAATMPFGTPDYAAPEQANGTADHRADIYSLGVVLYEMLTGERPTEKLEAPSKRVQVDVRIDEIVLRALEKTPELRFATAAEFRTQVEAVTNDAGPSVPPAMSASISKHSTIPRSFWIGLLVAFPVVTLSGAGLVLALGGGVSGRELIVMGAAAVIPGIVIPALIFIFMPGHRPKAGVPSSPATRLSKARQAMEADLLFPFWLRLILGAAFFVLLLNFAAPHVTRLGNNTQSTVTIGLSSPWLIVYPQHVRPDRIVRALAWNFRSPSFLSGVFAALIACVLLAGRATVRRRLGFAMPVRPWSRGRCVLMLAVLATAMLAVTALWSVIPLIKRLPTSTIIPTGSEIDRVDVTSEQAIVQTHGSKDAGLVFLFGNPAMRWTPKSLYLDAMFNVTLTSGGFEPGVRWSITPRRDIRWTYQLDGPTGIMPGKLAFHPGAPAADSEGAYVIGEFRPENGVPVPIAVRLEVRRAGFPTAAHIGRDGHSVLVTHDQAFSALHYVLYYQGDFGTTSTGTQNLATNTWKDEGAVKLKNGRTFGYRREALHPHELHINGTRHDLREGRVFALRDDGTVEQFRFFPKLDVARDPAAVSRMIYSDEASLGQNGTTRNEGATHTVREQATPPAKTFVQSYAVGFAFTGSKKDADWLDGFRAVTEHALWKAYPGTARLTEFTLNAESKLLIVKATLEEHMIVARMIAAMKGHAESSASKSEAFVRTYSLDFASNGSTATLKYADLRDLLEQIRELGLDSDISLHVVDRALIIKATPEQLKRVDELIEAMRKKAKPNSAAKRNP
ncbi:MAG TPA: hypothetical protein DIT64_05330, partial [Verrucomicrobiales bacterium]|nr:hypothetical protein [Verrucomicrobiales bacterium]